VIRTNTTAIDLEDLKHKLADHAEDLGIYLFGQPSKQTRNELRWGRKGSTVVNLSGRRQGSFRSWEEDRGGSMLDAIAFANDIPIAEAIRWARSWLGEDDRPRPAPRRRPIVESVDDEEVRRVEEVHRIFDEGRPVAGTAGEVYLRSRGIDSASWPDSIRWHRNCLVFASTCPTGETTALQRVYVNSDGTAKTDENGRKIKRSLGPRRKGAVRFSGLEDGPLCLAEGPETALSVWYATGFETWAALGAMGSVDLSPIAVERKIIVCKDDDARNAPSRKALRDAIRKWRAEGRTVLEILPFETTRRDKSDINDALVLMGPEYVRENIGIVLGSEAEGAAADLGLMEARKSLARATVDAVEELWRRKDDKPCLVLKVGVALGKTREALVSAVRWVEDGRGPVVIGVPTHDLSAELLQRAKQTISNEKADIRVAVWRGREAEDPNAIGETMCKDLATVKAVQAVVGDPQELVCEKSGRQCPFFESCPYQAQRRIEADIWLIANHLLFTSKPGAIPTPSLLVIDEAFWRAGVRGEEGHPVVVSEDQLAARPYKTKAVGGDDLFGTADLDATLTPIRKRLLEAVEINGIGPLKRASLIEADLTHDQAVQASKLEWRRKVEVGGFPGMGGAERRRVIAAAVINKDIPRMTRMWKEIANLLDFGADTSGRLSIEDIEDKSAGGRYRGIRLRWREDIREGWQAPTLHIDATVDLDLVHPYFPRAELRADIQAGVPHQRIVQHYDKTFSKAALAHDDKAVDKLWAWVRAQAFKKGGKWLVVTQKAVEDDIRSRFEIPSFIDLAHHNAIAGRDQWKDVDHLVVVGRTQPPPQAVAHIAGVLTGEHVEPLDGWYPATMQTLHAMDGTAITVEVDRHPDDLAEKIRSTVCEGEIVQIIGRGRGVNRTAANPLEVIVLGNVPACGEIDELQPWRGPTLDDRMVADDGVWLSSAEDQAIAYGGDARTVRKSRERSATFSYEKYLYENVAHLGTATYLRAGQGRKLAQVIYDQRIVLDIEAWLVKRLGPLAEIEVADTDSAAPGVLKREVSFPFAATSEILVREAEIVPPAGQSDPRVTEDPEYTSGIMPVDMRLAIRDAYQDAGITQDQAAQRLGLSRPHLANAMAGRYPLSEAKVIKLRDFLEKPPPVVQPRLI